MPMMESQITDDDLEATYELEAPFYIDPIISWRAWTVCAPGVCDCFEKRGRGRALIRSVTFSLPWLRRKATRAHCLNRWRNDARAVNGSIHHCAPDQTHGCGIYSVKSMEYAKEWGQHSKSKFAIIGEVKVWGRVLQYEDGYIAEYAYPLSFLVPDNYDYYTRADGTAEKGKPMIDPREIAYMLEESYGVEAYVGWE